MNLGTVKPYKNISWVNTSDDECDQDDLNPDDIKNIPTINSIDILRNSFIYPTTQDSNILHTSDRSKSTYINDWSKTHSDISSESSYCNEDTDLLQMIELLDSNTRNGRQIQNIFKTIVTQYELVNIDGKESGQTCNTDNNVCGLEGTNIYNNECTETLTGYQYHENTPRCLDDIKVCTTLSQVMMIVFSTCQFFQFMNYIQA